MKTFSDNFPGLTWRFLGIFNRLHIVYFYFFIMAIFFPVTGKATTFPKWHNGDDIINQSVNATIFDQISGVGAGFAQTFNNILKFHFEYSTQPIIFCSLDNNNTSINCDQSTNKTSHKTGGKGNDDFAHVFLLLGATLVGAIIGGFLSIRIARYLF